VRDATCLHVAAPSPPCASPLHGVHDTGGAWRRWSAAQGGVVTWGWHAEALEEHPPRGARPGGSTPPAPTPGAGVRSPKEEAGEPREGGRGWPQRVRVTEPAQGGQGRGESPRGEPRPTAGPGRASPGSPWFDHPAVPSLRLRGGTEGTLGGPCPRDCAHERVCGAEGGRLTRVVRPSLFRHPAAPPVSPLPPVRPPRRKPRPLPRPLGVACCSI
jgi:hypothetical protein